MKDKAQARVLLLALVAPIIVLQGAVERLNPAQWAAGSAPAGH